MKPTRRDLPRNKNDKNRDNPDPKETQNYDTQVTQDAPTIQMAPQVTQDTHATKMCLMREINNLSSAANELRSDLKQSCTSVSRAITSASSMFENVQADAHEIDITNMEQLNSTVHDLGTNNNEHFINVKGMLAIQIQK